LVPRKHAWESLGKELDRVLRLADFGKDEIEVIMVPYQD
jgi:hypothetical protein